MATETATTLVSATGTAPALNQTAGAVQHAATLSGGMKLSALGGMAGPAGVFKGMQAFALAHPLAMLGMVAGGLALVGISDTVRHFQHKRREAEENVTQNVPPKVW